MIEPVEKRRDRPTLEKRRGEIEQRLAAAGLPCVGRRSLRVVPDAAREEARGGSQLRLALESLGPVFSAFGRYLSTRVDLLSAQTCVELAAIPDHAAPSSFDAVRDIFAAELGCRPEEAYGEFEEAACESCLLYQTHRARLHDGSPVTVRVIHPEAERSALHDLSLLYLLEAAFAGEVSCLSFKSAAADFAIVLPRQLDLTNEAKAFTALAQDAADFENLRAPTLHRELCAPRVLTVERLAGVSLTEAAHSFGEGRDDDADAAPRDFPAGLNRTGLARLLCSVWLRQSLLGRAFPVEPRAENITILSDRQIAFTGGFFDALPAEPQANLWDYLVAVSLENPDRACACLLKELRAAGPPPDTERLRHSFRQVVPFRDSQWRGGEDEHQLAERLFVQWRLATECGYLPQQRLPSFYRGLFLMTDAAQRLAPDGDPLAEGLQDARLLASLSRWRETLNPTRFGDQFDRYAAMMLEMPRRLDEALTLVSEGSPRVQLHVPEAAEQRRQKNSSAVLNAWLLVLASVALLLPRVTASMLAEPWAERINTVIFIFVGALLLRAASRVR